MDVVKGIHLFNTMKVPTAALVENMALFVCRHGEEHRPFGERQGGMDGAETEAFAQR